MPRSVRKGISIGPLRVRAGLELGKNTPSHYFNNLFEKKNLLNLSQKKLPKLKYIIYNIEKVIKRVLTCIESQQNLKLFAEQNIRILISASMLGPNYVIANGIKSCTYCCSVLIVREGLMHWLRTGATQYHAQLGLPDKGRALKGWLSAM